MAQPRHRATASVFRALAHPERVHILELLSRQEMCVCELATVLHRRQAYVSQQLSVLRRAGLVVDRREGLQVFYRLIDPALPDLLSGATALGTRLRATAAAAQSGHQAGSRQQTSSESRGYRNGDVVSDH